MSSNDKLRQLIETLSHQIKTGDPNIQFIKHPPKLIRALKKLNRVVGMQTVKNNISDQVIFLIMASRNNEPKKYMLNTVFYGPPGVGKTKVGIILAEIWHALGYIEKKTTTYSALSNYNWDYVTLLIISLYLVYALQILAFMYHKIGIFYFSVLLGAVLLFALFAYVAFQHNDYFSKVVSSEQDEEIIRIVSRKDFVAEYVGQTAIKTKKLLDQNRGKVLFIDEAYSLLNDSRDPFGLEALTTLNQFMSENPDEIIVIFAGYKDKMQRGIFAEQPGLPRRCMWHFECNGYNGDELYLIFKTQLENEKWSIAKSDQKYIQSLINKYHYLFPAYGGDTERLCFFSKLESTNQAFHRGGSLKQHVSREQVERGLRLLGNNNIQKDNSCNPSGCSGNNRLNHPDKEEEINELMKLFQRFQSENNNNNNNPKLEND